MSKVRFFHSIVLSIAIVTLSSACSSSDSSSDRRSRRSLSRESTTTTKSKTTSTTAPTQNTTPIVEVPFLSPAQIPQTWTQANLCSLISVADAQSILNMTTAPTSTYSHSDTTGARCTFSTGSGDEIFIELSSVSFADARAVDTALNATTTPIVVDGVGGVSKTNKATGVTYMLNVSGAASNQWVVNAPTDSQTNDAAKLLITSLK